MPINPGDPGPTIWANWVDTALAGTSNADNLLTGTVNARLSRARHAPAFGLFFPEAEGCAADGITDDTVNAQAAILAAAGATLHIQQGTTLLLNGPLAVLANTKITGGGTLKFKANTTAFALIAATAQDKVTVEGITFDGNVANQTWNQSRHCLQVVGGTNVTISGCVFKNIIGDGIYVTTSGGVSPSNIDIDGNAFIGANTNRNGITVISALDSKIRGNYLYKMGRDDMPGAIDLEPNATTDTISNVVISGNVIIGGGTPGTQHAVSVNNPAGSTCTNIVIANNAIRDVFKYAISVFGNGADKTKTQVAISDNTLDVQVSLAGSAAIIASSWCEVNISDNTINSTADIGIKSVGSSFKISGNKIKNCVVYGIELNGGANESGSINGNRIEDCGSTVTASYGGIHIKASYIDIEGNKISSSATTKTQTGLYVESGVKNFIHANVFTGLLGVRSLSVATAPQVFGRNVYAAGFNSISGTYPPATETWLEGDVIEKPRIVAAGTVARWVCITAGTPGTWRAEYTGTPTSTTAALAAIGDAVNTTDKYAGKMYFNTTTNRAVYTSGGAAATVWAYADGTTAHTPV